MSLFRSRLAKEFDDRTARFHTSVVEDLRIFEDDINCTVAHDIMLHEQGIIPLKELKLILGALEEIRAGWRRGEIAIGAEFEDVHEYIETKVIERIGVEAGGMMHTGRSRNDQVVTDMRLRLREELLTIAEETLSLIEALQGRAAENAETLMILYTHGQHAQVGTLGAYLSSYADAFLRDYQRLTECYARVNVNPLGAGPVGGTSIAVDRARTTELLGFDGILENSIDATSGRDWAVEAASACAILMGNLSRAAADLLEWSAVEYGYVELADEYASSSSIMPQKKNPSTLELLRGKSSECYGALIELMTMVKGLPSGYCQDLQQTKLTLWRVLDVVETSLEVMTGIVKTLKVKPERMMRQVDGSFTMAVEVAEALAQDAGLSFREAYKITADLVTQTVNNGKTLKALKPEDFDASAERLFKKKVAVSQGWIDRTTDPRQSLMRRKSIGSPHPDEVMRMVREHGVALRKARAELATRRKKIESAMRGLSQTAEGYLKKQP